MSESALQPETINVHLSNVYPALVLLAGMQLDIFSPLAQGPCTVEALATTLRVKPGKLRPLLYALVTARLLTLEQECFANTPEAQTFLVKNQPRYLGGSAAAYADLWASTLFTAASIRAGAPQAKHDFSKLPQKALNAFIRGLDAGAAATARRLHKDYDLTHYRQLLDAGGGSGGLAIGLTRLCPTLQATVAELPNVAGITSACIAEAILEDRIQVLETDLLTGPIRGRYDLITLRAVLQVLSASDARRVVANVVATLEPGGRLFIIGRMLDNSRLSPPDAVAANVMFLNIYDEGQAYTENEYRTWLTEAGLGRIERQTLKGGYSVMSGIRR